MTSHDKTGYYEELGENFEAYMSDYDVERRRRLIFDSLIAGASLKGRSVLEIGSGTGRFSTDIVALDGELTVLDIGPKLVTDVVTAIGCTGVAGDALSLPFSNGAYEAVVSSECIEHTREPLRAVREMCRVCAPGGIVCFTTPNKLWYPVMRLSQKLRLRKYSGIENWIFARHAAAIMRSEGMENVLVSGCHLWPFQLRFSRPLLRRFDALGRTLHPFMINFGIIGSKPA